MCCLAKNTSDLGTPSLGSSSISPTISSDCSVSVSRTRLRGLSSRSVSPIELAPIGSHVVRLVERVVDEESQPSLDDALLNESIQVCRFVDQILLYVYIERVIVVKLARQRRDHGVNVHRHVYDLSDDSMSAFVSQSTYLHERQARQNQSLRDRVDRRQVVRLWRISEAI